ncbi:MAG: ATP-binding protein [bacterium]|nr:ATP-binding protein [bacterium]
MNLLWYNKSTAYSREEHDQYGQGHPKPIEITLEGVNDQSGESWDLTFSLRYDSTEQIYATPRSSSSAIIPPKAADLQVVHVPPFSGIGAEETRLDNEYQKLLIGQGKAGDILRNLLLEVSKSKEQWEELSREFTDIFGYTLLQPKYENSPFILCEYLNGKYLGKGTGGFQRLDIASAGSGLHQILLLLGFYFARPASVLLLDEPDAHLHVILQKNIYDRLRSLAQKRGCQLIIATHSEVLIDNTDPAKIISFFQRPHLLVENVERDRVREALKRLSSLDILLAEQSTGVLYVEGDSDFSMLRAFAKVLEHPLFEYLTTTPFWHSNEGRNPRESRSHLFSLQAINTRIHGVLLLDGDNRDLQDHELTASGLEILRWRRYEIENYILVPDLLKRFAVGQDPDLFSSERVSRADAFLNSTFPPDALKNPLNNVFLDSVRSSKDILPQFFAQVGIEIGKREYYQIAEQIKKDEVHADVKTMLDHIYSSLVTR